jgi:hypothetical protein
MNERRPIDFRTVVFVIFITAAFLAMPWLIHREWPKTHAQPLGYERGNERAAALNDVTTNGAAVLDSYGWRNKNEGIVRIPIVRAKELIAKEGQDPAAARKQLLGLAAKAFTPPPKAPEKKSEYE